MKSATLYSKLRHWVFLFPRLHLSLVRRLLREPPSDYLGLYLQQERCGHFEYWLPLPSCLDSPTAYDFISLFQFQHISSALRLKNEDVVKVCNCCVAREDGPNHVHPAQTMPAVSDNLKQSSGSAAGASFPQGWRMLNKPGCINTKQRDLLHRIS